MSARGSMSRGTSKMSPDFFLLLQRRKESGRERGRKGGRKGGREGVWRALCLLLLCTAHAYLTSLPLHHSPVFLTSLPDSSGLHRVEQLQNCLLTAASHPKSRDVAPDSPEPYSSHNALLCWPLALTVKSRLCTSVNQKQIGNTAFRVFRLE